MSERITLANVQHFVNILNKELGYSESPYTGNVGNIGTRYIHRGENGYSLYVIANENGGVHESFYAPTLRILRDRILSFIHGIYAERERKEAKQRALVDSTTSRHTWE